MKSRIIFPFNTKILIIPIILLCITFYGDEIKDKPSFLSDSGFLSISENNMRSLMNLLASPEMEGRETSERGNEIASKIISNEFLRDGFSPGGDKDTYYQEISLVKSELDKDSSGITIRTEVKDAIVDEDWKIGCDCFIFPHSNKSLTIKAPLIFAGYGITAPEYKYDDYKNIDAKGKIVIVLNHEPGENDEKSPFDGKKRTKYSMPQLKSNFAAIHGATGLIIIPDLNNPHPPIAESLARYSGFHGSQMNPADEESIITYFLSEDSARKLMSFTGRTISEIQAEVDQKGTVPSLRFSGLSMTIRYILKEKQMVKSRNVIGILKGSDPKLSDEYIVIGAHYDHLGVDKNGQNYQGADDNASGTCGILEIAKAFSTSLKPKRSIIFMAFTGEEKGLYGSKYFTKHPYAPIEKIKVMINLDMIGRNNMDKDENKDMVIAYYNARTPIIKEIMDKYSVSIELKITHHPEMAAQQNSDNSPFADFDIPYIFFFTGFHKDYHQPTDTPDKINFNKMTKVAKETYLILRDIADGTGIHFDMNVKEAPKPDDYEKPF